MKKNRKNKTAPPPGLPPEEKPPIEEQPKKQPFLKRLLFGEETPDLSELEAGSTTILDILSPTSVDTKSRDYIVVDGIFHAYLYITGYGYSTTVGASWLAPLVEAGEGVSISFHFDKQSKEKILAKISQQTMMNRSRMRDVADTRQDFEELDSAIASGMYLKDVMNRQGEDFYYMHTLIEVTAPDPETLEQRATEVEKLCVSVDMIARRCDYKNEQAFLSSLPILSLDPDIERKARRNALTSGVAAAFPFASYELSDHNGIFLGLNLYNRSPVFLDPYDDYKYTNGNWWIGGSTGAGKTVTLQCLGGRLREQGNAALADRVGAVEGIVLHRGPDVRVLRFRICAALPRNQQRGSGHDRDGERREPQPASFLSAEHIRKPALEPLRRAAEARCHRHRRDLRLHRREQRFAVGGSFRVRHALGRPAVAGKLHILVRLPQHPIDERVEPVDGVRRRQHELIGKVVPLEVAKLVAQDEAQRGGLVVLVRQKQNGMK